MSLLSVVKELRAERKKIADQATAILTKAHKEGRGMNGDENAELYQMGGETRWFLHAPSLTSPRSIIVLRISSCSSS